MPIAESDSSESESGSSIKSEIKSLLKFFYINEVPSYGNNFFFTLGVYLLELFAILAVTGIIMLIFGPYWWDLTTVGAFVRSIHLWAAEAFVTIMFLHLFVQFSTSAYKQKKLVWMIGVVLLLLVLLEYAFGIGLEGGFVSQWNDKAGADLWDGLGLGYWINPLNNGALLGWHVAIVPILLIFLIFTHFMLVKNKGLNKPYKKGIPYTMVPADHKSMYKRMVYIFAIVLVFAILLRSPYVPPLTIQSVAQSNPNIMAITLLSELNQSSHTATYLDTIDPYTFNTSTVYVVSPYDTYINSSYNARNYMAEYLSESPKERSISFSEANSFFSKNWSMQDASQSSDPLIVSIAELVKMAQAGTYQEILQSEETSGLNYTYVIRFLSDTREFQSTASAYGLRTVQWGMLKAGGMWWQVGSYWMAPYDYMEIITSGLPWWNDLENGIVATVALILLLFLPYLPYLRDIPDKLRLYKIFWNRFTIPEMKKIKKKK
ncbi:cytochrome b subunit of the bc complex [Candidatus Mancarchaeum acidiphilum]|uniref:Cytochrome b subunit of the bc complex n=1 Tax=Candidatus Mancarchaeum acidiphilum TaxID=1920749 RepID=A0A218NM38_9ARCH|nr:cytochrome b N-terminal domain-containing protein [Candidatus Mancarchaeum acidiphilum]ASI13526.1 cytochrome b subunit of the bc complex [Candidatus Mancarchaeum acidiphilum]